MRPIASYLVSLLVAIAAIVAATLGDTVLAWFLAGVALLAVWTARRLAHALAAMRRTAERVARGELADIPAVVWRDASDLAVAFNAVVRELRHQVASLTARRNELEAVLDAMGEGVLAVDTEERLVRANPAACDLLDLDPGDMVGRPIRELVRLPGLHRLIEHTLRQREAQTLELALRGRGGDERSLQVSGAPLRGGDDHAFGALIVLMDLTQVRRLESVRRDFAANVSHELRTPVTAIRGAAETLDDGALEEPEDARRFVQIIRRQAERLQAIIEDLLSLARIERIEEGERLNVETVALSAIVAAATQNVADAARQKRIQIHSSAVVGPPLRVNRALIEQALTNLLDNAVKYSDPGRDVHVRSDSDDREVRIEVCDRGPGIPEPHIARLFERFYRVDPSRSREVGGTGLGLAIVKHIMQAHGGRASVTSSVGRGSTFVLHVPRPEHGEAAAAAAQP